jgi:hypothetical protein
MVFFEAANVSDAARIDGRRSPGRDASARQLVGEPGQRHHRMVKQLCAVANQGDLLPRDVAPLPIRDGRTINNRTGSGAISEDRRQRRKRRIVNKPALRQLNSGMQRSHGLRARPSLNGWLNDC